MRDEDEEDDGLEGRLTSYREGSIVLLLESFGSMSNQFFAIKIY